MSAWGMTRSQQIEQAAQALLSDALSDRSLPPYLRRHLYAIKETIAIPDDGEAPRVDAQETERLRTALAEVDMLINLLKGVKS